MGTKALGLKWNWEQNFLFGTTLKASCIFVGIRHHAFLVSGPLYDRYEYSLNTP